MCNGTMYEYYYELVPLSLLLLLLVNCVCAFNSKKYQVINLIIHKNVLIYWYYIWTNWY